MKKINKKRIISYLIDIIFVLAIFSIISYFIKDSKELIDLKIKYNNLTDVYLENTLTFSKYFSDYSKITYQIDRNSIHLYIIELLLIIIYFVIIPYITNGYTLGKYLMKIKITEKTKNKISLISLIKRAFIINGMGFILTSLILLFITSNETFFISITILGILQILLVIISVFMIIYKEGKCGFHEKISKTKVIEVTK